MNLLSKFIKQDNLKENNKILGKTQMELIKGIDALGKGLWIKKHKILVVGDLHIGYEEALAKSGIILPKNAFEKTKKELFGLISKAKPREIVINGDLKHEFGKLSGETLKESLNLLKEISKKCEKVIVVKGNHDDILEAFVKDKKIEFKEYYFIKEEEKIKRGGLKIRNICIVHGDKIIKNEDINVADILIMGHEHPAIILEEGPKKEKYKCFLVGKWKNKKLIVIPSFFPLTEGTAINREKLLSPYLHQEIGKFKVYLVGDKVYRFGNVKNFD